MFVVGLVYMHIYYIYR